ncbi:hypothetical protein [Streptomyces sp. KS 21]|uniref:hypothetical protein n=1 Tax=Streptomyces sp. KS 21 TaxID=2485150 RepID=UPI0010F42F03|nr:hypothetical protein [Streptomyces sp. KS 21]TDU67099.1 hypothetical protein EDD91_8132 [Streptomyces sp. KS 21]
MANIVWHTTYRLLLDLKQEDLGHENFDDLWNFLYKADRMAAQRNVPVSERGLQCGGVCKDAGVVAWMYLRQQANGRREAVHERKEDEDRHKAPMSDEHKAYQERILRAAEEGGFHGDCEVRTPVGRSSFIQTDTLIEGADGRRIGWEVQLSSAGFDGPASVKSRATKAAKRGITPAWHTDRADYARRSDTQWTRSNNLPAHVIAKIGDLRVISGYRALDFWVCDLRAVYPCPDGVRRCGKPHVTPKPRDVLFDDLVRRTAAGMIVPVEYLRGTKVDRFWVTDADRDRLAELQAGVIILPPAQPDDSSSKTSPNLPTCRPTASLGGSVPAVVVASDATVLIPQQRAFAPAPPPVEAFAPGPQPLRHPAVLSAPSSPPAPGEAGPGKPEPEQVTPPSADFPPEIEQVYDPGVTTTAPEFPDDLLQLQERLHRTHAEHRAYLAELPWSVEPLAGWARGERFSHRGDVPDSPGWSDEQKETVDRMWTEIRELSSAVVDHPHWATIPRDAVVNARMQLKKQTRPAVPSDVAEAA